ncbi:MAG: hypothetical protein HY657_10150 [Acidobacteria bacterium]|nr:hypothetical protein [Acidobacteriota bacterium]
MAATSCACQATFCGTPLPKVWRPRLTTPARSRFGDLVLAAFLLAQCFDGVFTYVGVTTFGIGVEANPIVAGLMTQLGHGTGLMGAKGVAAGFGIYLHLQQIHGVVALLTGLYAAIALAPWTFLLFF